MTDRYPDIYIIGAQKAGTTTLFDWLSQHPDIFAHHLSKDYPFFTNDRIYLKERKTYLSFAKKAPISQLFLGGDANTMFCSKAPNRLSTMIPRSKLIAILRNPADRAYSAFCHSVERSLELRSFEEAIRDEMEGKQYSQEKSYYFDYLKHGLYCRQLQTIYNFYNDDQVKVILFDDLKNKPKEVFKDIFSYLDVDASFVPKLKTHNKTLGGYRFKHLAKFTATSLPPGITKSILRSIIPFNIRTIIRRKITSMNRIEGNKPLFLNETRTLLLDYYRKENKELELLLGKNLASWYE